MQEPHCILVSKVGLGAFEAELREVDAFSFGSFAPDMDRVPSSAFATSTSRRPGPASSINQFE